MKNVRKRMKGRMIACLLACSMALSLLPVSSAQAAVELDGQTIANYANGRVGTWHDNGMCLAFAESVYQNLGGPRPYDCCAFTSGSKYIKNNSSANIPVGATVYFANTTNYRCSTCGNKCGHIGIYVGGGYFVHGGDGDYVQKTALSDNYYAPRFRGWGYLGNFTLKNGGSPDPAPNFTQDSKYNAVKGFKGYTLSTGKVELLESNLSTRIGYIYATDECTVHELYTNGWCKVTCPWDGGGTRTGYTKISNFIQTPTAALGSYTANTYINLYSKPGLGTQIYQIYPNDVCRTIGTSGSATQVFMPMSGKGYYELGWAKLPSVIPTDLTIDTRYPTPFKCRILSSSNSAVSAYRGVNDPSTYLGHVYVNDDCMIQAVYTNGWCQFTCPFFGKVETVYGKFSDFSSCNVSPYSLNASKRADTYYKSDRATKVGWVDSGDTVTVIATSGSMSQIIYPADVGKRCGWVDSSVPVERYTVSYNANGGSGAPAAQTANKGTEITLSAAAPTREGYTFAGWTDAKGYVLYPGGSKYYGNASITLYASWRKNEYEIKYDANGGAQDFEEQTQRYGEAVVVPSAASMKQGVLAEYGIEGMEGSEEQNVILLDRKFLSWNTKADGSGTTVQAGQNYTPNASVTLYAQYGKASFTDLLIPGAPGRTGYTFVGWYDSKDGGNKIEAGKEISPDLGCIYAHWTVNSYTISYDANGGSSAPQSQTKVFGETLKLSDTKPTRNGYIFKGWALAAGSCEVAYESGSEYKENEAAVLYAVWDEVKAELSAISIAQEPAKKTYNFGEELDTTGLKLRLTYTSGSTEEVTSGYTVTGYDSRKAGTQTLTITYGGKTANFTVTVKAQPIDEVAVVTIEDVVGAAPGEEVEVDIQLTKNPGFSFMMLRLTYDKDALELVEASNKTSGNNLFMMNDTIMWDSAHDVAVGSTIREAMGTVTFRIKPEIALDEDKSALCTIGINEVTCYNEEEKEVTVRANAGTISVDAANYGDVNCDGKIDEKDVQALRVYMATGKLPEGCDAKAADVNGDGRIWAEDIIRLNRYLEDPDSVTLGYDRDKAIGSNGEVQLIEDVELSVKNISEVKDGRITMDLALDENPGIAALSIGTDFDMENMELVSVTNGTVIDGTVTQDPDDKGILNWMTDKVSQKTGTLAILTFQIKDGSEAGDYPVSAHVVSCYDDREKLHYGESQAVYVAVPLGTVAVEGITLDEAALTLAGGDVVELTANVLPLDATDKTVTWTSSDKAVAVVSGNGQIHALKKGSAVVTATVSGASGKLFKASCTITVTSDAPVLNVTLNEDPDRKKDESGEKPDDKVDNVTYRLSTETGSAKIAAGKKIKMKVTGSNGRTLSNSKLKWKSKNTKVATVNTKGVVTLKKNSGGKKVVITATLKSGSKQQLKYTIQSMKGAVKSIRITGKKNVKPGKSLKLKAVIKTTKGKANKKLQWKSSNAKLAKVTSTGTSVTVKTYKGKKGTVKITVAATDGSGKKKTVTIKIK